eukprot:scaffold75035_cov56-Phaeocystis_antarctica.AAC.2
MSSMNGESTSKPVSTFKVGGKIGGKSRSTTASVRAGRPERGAAATSTTASVWAGRPERGAEATRRGWRKPAPPHRHIPKSMSMRRKMRET